MQRPYLESYFIIWLALGPQAKTTIKHDISGFRDFLSQTKGEALTSLWARLNSLQYTLLKGENLTERAAIKEAVTLGWSHFSKTVFTKSRWNNNTQYSECQRK